MFQTGTLWWHSPAVCTALEFWTFWHHFWGSRRSYKSFSSNWAISRALIGRESTFLPTVDTKSMKMFKSVVCTWVLNILTSFLTVGVDNGKLLPFLKPCHPHVISWSWFSHKPFPIHRYCQLLLKLIPRKWRQNTESRKIVTSEFRPRQIVDGKKINEKNKANFYSLFMTKFLGK